MPSTHTLAVLFGVFVCVFAAPVHAQTSEATVVSEEAEVRGFGQGIDRARATLKANYSGVLDRQDLGFDHNVDNKVVADFQSSVEEELQKNPLNVFFKFSAPILVFVLFMLVLSVLDKRSLLLALRRQARIDIHGADWVNKLVRALILLIGRSAPIGALIMLSYFPIQALNSASTWSVLLTEVLWLYLVFRACHAMVVASFAFRLFEVSDKTAHKLQRWGIWTVRVVFFWLATLLVEVTLGYHGPVARFVEFLFLVSLVGVTIGLARLKREVIEVLQIKESASEHSRLIRATEKYYQPFMVLTVLLLLLGALGWVEAASFILIRAYGAVTITFMSLRVSQWMKTRIEVAANNAQTREQIDLFRGIGTMLRGAGYLFFMYVAIRLLRLWEPIETLLEIPLFLIGSTPLRSSSVIEAVIFLTVAVFVGRLIRALLLTRVYPALQVDVGVGYAINTLINYAMIVVGFMLGLAALGVDLSSLTVVMASLGVGIGLGLQTFTENLISGFILLFGRSVKKGDVITVGEIYGRVDDVGARSVVIKTPDNYDMLIPSKTIVSGEVINWSYHDPLIRLRLPVGVTYNCKPRQVQRILLAVARSHRKIKRRPAPEVLLKEFGDSSVNFELLVYYDIRSITRDRLVGQLNFLIWDKLEEAGIEIPFPQRDLHLRSIDPALVGRFAPEEE